MPRNEPTYVVTLHYPNGEKVDPRRVQLAPVEEVVSAFADAALEAQRRKEDARATD